MDYRSMVAQLMQLSRQGVEPGNIDLANRPQVPMGNGQTATVRSMSVGMPQGEVLMPTIREDGWPMSEKQAVEHFRKTGKHLGIFKTPQEADFYAQLLHRQQEQFYGPK
jgi:hypothetical protein